MSRCFPFPPPGYEKKVDVTDLLKKEKRKEKKQKKDKKDEEKRDDKERKERKHKEKKDKHKEKKKDKEKRVDQQFQSRNGGPLLQNDEQNKQKDVSSGHRKSSAQPQNGQRKEFLIRKEERVQSLGQTEKMLVNKINTEDIDNSKLVQELGRRIREEERTGSLQFPVESRKSNGDRGETPKLDGQGITNKSTSDRMSMVQNTINDQKSRERVKEKTELKKADGHNSKYMKNSDTLGFFNNLSTYNTPNVGIPELKKRKVMEANGFSHENELRPHKTARPTSNILTENGKKQDFLQNPGLSQPGKEQKVNGTIASQPMCNTMSPISKKPPISTANHIMVKPGSTRSPPVNKGQIPSQPLPAPTSRPSSSVPNHITNKPLPVSTTKPSQPLLNSKTKESLTPPHPDTKYLKQILAVPELDQWSGLDDQEWLFSSKDFHHFREKAGKKIYLQDNKEIEVWSEAKQLESVDVCALPYVIPY